MAKKLTKEKIRKPYIQKVIVVTKGNINKFVRPEWHREFRRTHINKIRNALFKGEHPSENITVNQLNGYRMRIINGNHRMEAIRQIMDEHKNFKIELTLTVYSNLNKEEEVEIYEKVNNTKPETGLDRLKAHLSGTELMRVLEEDMPFRVVFRHAQKGERNIMTAGAVLFAYFNRDKVGGGMTIKRMLPKIEVMENIDYKRLVDYGKFFKDVFGEPSKDNIYASFNIYVVVAKLYYSLVGVGLSKEELKSRLRKLMARHTSDLMIYVKGIDKQVDMYRFIYNKIKGRNKLFSLLEN